MGSNNPEMIQSLKWVDHFKNRAYRRRRQSRQWCDDLDVILYADDTVIYLLSDSKEREIYFY